MYAQVIINQPNINIDQYFDYKIPEKLLNNIKIGQRVIVPLVEETKNRCLYHKNKSFSYVKEKRLKYIEQIIDLEPMLSSNQLKLSQWIKNNYLCLHRSYSINDTYRYEFRKKINIILNKNITTEKLLCNLINEEEKKILEYLIANKGEIWLELLQKEFKGNLYKKILQMAKKKYISIEEHFYTKVSDKREKYITLSGKYKSKDKYLKEISKNAHKQLEIINSLEHHPISYSELYKDLKFNKSSIDSLLKKAIKINSQMLLEIHIMIKL